MIQLLRRNWEYKLLSLALSILLYFIASGQRNPSRTISLGVQPEVTGLPANLAVRVEPRTEMVSLTGATADLDVVRKAGVRATVSAGAGKVGRSSLPIQYELPPNVRARVTVDGPSSVEIELDERTERPMPVRVLFENQPPPGYEFQTPSTIPLRVAVTGLSSEVNRVARVVALLDNTRGAGSVEREVPVVAQDEKEQVVSTVQLRPARVQVSIALRKAPATKVLLLSPQFVGNAASGVRLVDYRFSPASVTVRGETTNLSTLSSLTVPISVEGLSHSEVRPVTLTPPLGVVLVGEPKARLTLTVQGGAPPSPNP